MFFRLASSSLRSRRGSVVLTVAAIAVSVFVLLGIEHLRNQSKASFSSTVSGVDLIVGARTGSLNLLLYSVFRVGSPTNNINWQTYQAITEDPQVKWSIPISLGDSHKGFRVLGTTPDYFEHFSYGQKRKLELVKGEPFEEVLDVVLGSEVAKSLGYDLGQSIVIAHGIAATSFTLHDDKPFTVVGILKPTGTPVDQTLHVSLEAIEAIHSSWKQGEDTSRLEPKAITAFLLGLNSRMSTFQVQRSINDYRGEPLMAILPGVALSELWQMMAILENTLSLVSFLVLIAALLGLSSMLLASMRERQREIAILRTLGASPGFLFLLIQLEALLLTAFAILAGTGLLWLVLTFTADLLATSFGLFISTNVLSVNAGLMAAMIMGCAAVAAIVPAYSAYRDANRLS